MKRSRCTSATLCVILFGPCLSASAEYVFTTIEYPGAVETQVFGISNSGEVVGQHLDGSGTYHGFVLANGTFESFDIPSSLGTSGFDMNSLGNVVGIYGAPGGTTRAFLGNRDGFINLVPLAGSPDTRAFSINDAGHAVGYYERTSDSYFRGYLYNGSYTTLNYPGALASKATGINNQGDVVGSYFAAGAQHGFLLSGGVYTTVDPPGALFPEAWGINDSGQIVGVYQSSFGVYHGYIKNGSTYTPIDVPNASDTQAYAISNDGRIVGVYEDGAGLHGFLATPAAAADFDVDGDVDEDDLAAWSGNFAKTPGALRSQGDANTDGAVDGADFLLWQRQVTASSAVSSAVPEPGALAPGGIAWLAGLAGLRRGRLIKP
jgi:uncharacterized membrane protein